MKEKRILYVQDKFGLGGINRITSVKENYFVSHQYEVHNFCCLDEGSILSKERYDKRIIFHTIRKQKLDELYNIPLVGRLCRYLYFRIKFLIILYRINPDIIIVTQPFLEPLLVVVMSFWKKRILEFHGWYNGKDISHIKIKERIISRYKLKFYNVVSLSKREAEHVYNITKNHSLYIHNPLYKKPIRMSNCDSKKVVVLSRLSSEKNLLDLVFVWKSIEIKHPDWSLHIYGDGVEKKKILDGIKQNGLLTMYLHSYIMDPFSVLLDSSIYVLTSAHEGFPLVLVEAMSIGVPCVAYDCPYGPSEIIKDGEDGFLVKTMNPIEMIQKVNLLIEDEDLRKRMGKYAAVNVKRFDINKIMGQWVSLFDSL
ncbi:MAG: glycosyltransferase [Prevotella sp.]|nr:glycosyltransferase [Prevotella sp.]